MKRIAQSLTEPTPMPLLVHRGCAQQSAAQGPPHRRASTSHPSVPRSHELSHGLGAALLLGLLAFAWPVIAAYVNFAMHPDTCGGSQLGADWPGALSRVLAGYHGTNHLTLVANGTCGNLNHLDTSWRWPQGTPIEPHRIATLLGAAVFRAYKDLAPLAAGPLPLRAKSELVELANENIGYVPDRRSYAEGNYEPESARCAAGSGEKLVEAAVKLLLELHD